MSVTLRPYNGGPDWEVDIRIVFPDGSKHRVRKKAPVSSKSGARRWAEDREREIIRKGPAKCEKEVVPTLAEFASRFIDGYASANRHKQSGIAAKQTILDTHLVPQLGARTLDAIGNEEIQDLKCGLTGKAPKTVNNILSVLNTLLTVAVEWEVISEMPCRIRLLKVPKSEMSFHDFDVFERLVTTASKVSPEAHMIVLLGGEAGLRCGEMMALECDSMSHEAARNFP